MTGWLRHPPAAAPPSDLDVAARERIRRPPGESFPFPWLQQGKRGKKSQTPARANGRGPEARPRGSAAKERCFLHAATEKSRASFGWELLEQKQLGVFFSPGRRAQVGGAKGETSQVVLSLRGQ